MNILMLTMAAAIVLWAAAGTAGAADTRPYFAMNLGGVIDAKSTIVDSERNASGNMSTSPGYAASGAVGLDFGAVRVEAEIGYRTTDVNTIKDNNSGVSEMVNGTTQLMSYMLNGHLTIPGHAPVKPFITGGIGCATANWSSLTIEGTPITINSAGKDTEFAYQAGIGASYDATRNVSFDAAYRYFGTTDFYIGDYKASYASHNIMLGIRYRF